MAKRIFYDDDARRRVLAGAETLYNAVKTTMGPLGRNVIITRQYGAPTVSHDGITVARAVDIPVEDNDTLGYHVGAELIKQAGSNMEEVGDGTTTVTVLTYHLLHEANRLIAAGHNPQELRKGIEAATAEALELLSTYNIDIKENQDKIASIATISAGDYDIGKLIAEVIAKVGKDGSVSVEEGNGLDLSYDIVEGFSVDRGFISHYLVTDQTRQEAIYKNVPVIIADQRISSVQEIAPLLDQIMQSGHKDVFIIAEDIEGEALGMLIMNKLKGNFNAIAIKSPSFGERQKEILDDIAAFTGAAVLRPESGLSLANAQMSELGSAAKVVVCKDETTIIKGGGAQEDIDLRIAVINTKIEEATNEFEKDVLIKRRAALTGKVALIKVGGATETEIEEKKYRVDDAVAAAKAALSEGIVAGGGVTLLNIANEITSTSDNETERAGIKAFKQALSMPFTILLENSGINPYEWLPRITNVEKGKGIDVRNPDVLVNLVKVGVIDPTKVTREAVKNASSIAATTITMGALIVDIPQEGGNNVQ